MGVAICLIVATAALYAIKKHELDGIDSRTYCAKPLKHLTVVLVDQTDALNKIQMADLKGQLGKVASNIPPNGMLKIVSVTSDPAALLVAKEAFCNPGDENTVNSMTGNKAMQQQDYLRNYTARISKVVDSLATQAPSKTSPIMEAVQAVNIANFKGRDIADKNLIVVSDFLQNSAGVSFYQGVPEFETFERGPFWPSVKSDFATTHVDLRMVYRSDASQLQTLRLKNFWRVYFTNQNSSDPSIGDING